MKKLLIFAVIICAFSFQGCMRDQEDNVGSLQVNTAINSVNDPRWHAADDIQFFLTTETGFYEGSRTANIFNSFKQGNFRQQIQIPDLLPGNYVIGFYAQSEEGQSLSHHLPFQIIGGRTTNVTLQ